MKTGVVRQNISNETGFRIDPSFHLSEALQIQSDLRNSPYPLCTVADVSEKIFIGNIFSRNFVSKPDHGVPYLAASDTVLSNIDTGRFLSKNQAKQLSYLILKKDWILVTCSGTLGNVTYTNAVFENHIATHDLIRIIPSNQLIRSGVLYAFLASKYGYYQLTQSKFGGVVKHINSNQAGSVCVPVFSSSFQEEVHQLVINAATLREEAASKLEEAKQVLIDFIDIPFLRKSGFKTAIKSSKDIIKSLKLRFDPPVHVYDSVSIFNTLRDKCVSLGDCNVKIWYPGMFKRVFVDNNNGFPYIQGSSVFERNPFKNCDYLSKTKTPKLSDLWLNCGLILISCAGLCGQVKLITKEYEDHHAIGSPDIIRLQSDDSLFTTGYLFTYLQLPIVYDYMQSLKYGSVIERFDVPNVASIPVIKPTQELSDQISSFIDQYSELIYSSFCKEQEAISMVENEIEKWTRN